MYNKLMDFQAVFKFLIPKLQQADIDFALIGGMAFPVWGYYRATLDIDLLINQADSDKVRIMLKALGYDVAHQSDDVLNMVGRLDNLGRLDFLLAHRKYAQAMLKRAEPNDILEGKFKVKVLRPEDLIGLKIQSSSNDESRYNQDAADIEKIAANRPDDFDWNLVKEYFELFDRKDEYLSLKENTKHA